MIPLVYCRYICKSKRVRSVEQVRRLCDDLASNNADKFFADGTRYIAMTQANLESGNKCDRCFLRREYCICNWVKQVCSEKGMKTSVKLFMHYKEWGRSSNTGKLMHIGYPDHVKLSLFGDRKQQEQLVEELLSKPSIILYPNGAAEDISLKRDWIHRHESVNVCVIDSTWNQSKSMDRYLPDSIPRVNIASVVAGGSQFLLRKQAPERKDSGRVCTLEATAMALEALGENPAVIESLYNSLHLSVDQMMTLSGREIVYGNENMKARTLAALRSVTDANEKKRRSSKENQDKFL